MVDDGFENAPAWVLERDAGYDFDYVRFVHRFLPQRGDRRDTFHDFFGSLCLYVPLLLSSDIELQRVDSISSAFCYGVFARRELGGGDVVAAVRGELVNLTADEEAALHARGSNHSLLHMMREEVHRARVPEGVVDLIGARARHAPRRASKRPRLERRASSSSTHQLLRFVVAGGMSFLNTPARCTRTSGPGSSTTTTSAWHSGSCHLEAHGEGGGGAWLDYTGGGDEDQPYVCMRCRQS